MYGTVEAAIDIDRMRTIECADAAITRAIVDMEFYGAPLPQQAAALAAVRDAHESLMKAIRSLQTITGARLCCEIPALELPGNTDVFAYFTVRRAAW